MSFLAGNFLKTEKACNFRTLRKSFASCSNLLHLTSVLASKNLAMVLKLGQYVLGEVGNEIYFCTELVVQLD